VGGSGTFSVAQQSWALRLDLIKFMMAGKVGLKIAGGYFDYAYQFMGLDLLRITGFYWDQTGFRADKLGFEWGESIEPIVDFLVTMIEKAKNVGHAVAEGATKVTKAVASTVEDLWEFVASW